MKAMNFCLIYKVLSFCATKISDSHLCTCTYISICSFCNIAVCACDSGRTTYWLQQGKEMKVQTCFRGNKRHTQGNSARLLHVVIFNSVFLDSQTSELRQWEGTSTLLHWSVIFPRVTQPTVPRLPVVVYTPRQTFSIGGNGDGIACIVFRVSAIVQIVHEEKGLTRTFQSSDVSHLQNGRERGKW